MTVLIIDDDPKSHKMLKGDLVEHHPDIEVVGSGFDMEEGIDLLLKHRPNLIFLDIQLGSSTAFDLLSRISDFNLDFYIIFITAYDKYAITAIRFGALDFLVKPIDLDELSFALKKARTLQRQKISNQQLKLLLESYQNAQKKQLPSRLAIASKSDISYITVDTIVRLEADQVYTVFHLSDNRKPVISSTNLGKYVDQFKLYREFVQVHRSHMINIKFVKKYVKGEQIVILRDGTEVGVGRSFLERFQKSMREF